MTLEQIILWIVVGGVAGLLADAVVSGTRLGLIEAIVVGILGAFLGGWLFAHGFFLAAMQLSHDE